MPNCDVGARQSAGQVDKHRSFSIITRKVGTRILRASAHDIRFPTSLTLDGSDAMNRAPDYSAAYVILETDHPGRLAGHGLTFTIGRRTELCVAAIERLSDHVVGRTLEDIAADMAGFLRRPGARHHRP